MPLALRFAVALGSLALAFVSVSIAACSSSDMNSGPDAAPPVDATSPPHDGSVPPPFDAGADGSVPADAAPPVDAPVVPYCDGSTVCDWPQFAHDPQHTGNTAAVGQPPSRLLAQITFDPFLAQEQAESFGDLLAHFQAPLTVGHDVYMLVKAGTYVSCQPPGSGELADGGTACGPNAWDSQLWTEKRYNWDKGQLVEQWTFTSDWKPEPSALVFGWEPVFQPAISGSYLYVPGAGGALWKIDRITGQTAAHIEPFGATVDPDTYVAGGLTVDAAGDILYDALKLDPTDVTQDASGWLVKVTPTDAVTTATFASIVPDAPAPSAMCDSTFDRGGYALPYPPAPDDAGNPIQVPQVPCLSQRPGVNVSPAVGSDGTIYTVSRAHGDRHYSYLVAVNPDLTPKWDTTLRGHLDDGCGVLEPSTALPGPDGSVIGVGCRVGATQGVDPDTNDLPAPWVEDDSSSTPVVLPDGTIVYGALSTYNLFRGKLMHFGADGAFLGSYDFGWDTTPAVREPGSGDGGGAFSLVTKDNHYAQWDGGNGPYLMTWLDPTLTSTWGYQNTNTNSCVRGPDGGVTCTSDQPNGFEWCVNAPAVDGQGLLYANSEDGNLYVIDPALRTATPIFLELSLGAAYTPVGIDYQGRVYALNGGTMRVLGQ
jgi:hypothetical protein